MKSTVFLLCLFSLGILSSSAAHSATKGSRLHSKKFAWEKLLGIGIEVHFGQSIPGCKCCYGGICEFKLGSAMTVKGPLDDTKVGSFADGILANDQAIIGVGEDGAAYLIFSHRCTRPELQGSTLTLKTPPESDPELQRLYGIAPMKAGSYPIMDNGLFKMIRMN